MTSPLTQESNARATWDFSSVFVALERPFLKSFSRSPSDDASIPSLHTSISGSPQLHIQDKPAKDRSDLDINSALGDFSNALSFLGYSVSVAGPIDKIKDSIPDSSEIDCLSTLALTPAKDSLPTTPKSTPTIEKPSIEKDLDARKVTANRAENGRRAVLDGYLGRPSESPVSNRSNQKWLSPKTPQKGFSSGYMVSTVPKRDKKQASMIVLAEKKVQVILELHKRFPKELGCLSSIANQSQTLDANGIHCFVDISNVRFQSSSQGSWANNYRFLLDSMSPSRRTGRSTSMREYLDRRCHFIICQSFSNEVVQLRRGS